MAIGYTLESRQICCGCGLQFDLYDGFITLEHGVYVVFVCDTCK